MRRLLIGIAMVITQFTFTFDAKLPEQEVKVKTCTAYVRHIREADITDPDNDITLLQAHVYDVVQNICEQGFEMGSAYAKWKALQK